MDFYNACRNVVFLDKITAKKRIFDRYADEDGTVECELTGKRITNFECHLDHAWPSFGQIEASFWVFLGMEEEIPDGVLTKPCDGQLTTYFLNDETAQAFRELHRKIARTRIVSAKANLQAASSARRPKLKMIIEF